MTFSAQVTSVTREFIVPDLFSQVNVGSPLALMLLSEATAWTSGTSYDIIVKYAESTNGGVTGIADQLDSNRQDNRTKMRFEPKSIYKPVVVADIEVVLNQGDERVLDLVQTEMSSQLADLLEDFADQAYIGTGSGNQWNSVSTAADDGTNYATYGSLSRTTYPSLDGYYLASTGSLTLAKMATAYDAVTKGSDHPTGIFTTKALWSVYEALLTPTVSARYTSEGDQMASMSPNGIVVGKTGLSGTQGFRAVTYRGTPVMSDEHCPSGKMFLLNTRKTGRFPNFGLAGIKRTQAQYKTVNFDKKDGSPTGTFGSSRVPKGFNFRDLMQPVDQLAEVGYLLTDGEILAAEPRLQGQLTGVTA